MYRVLIYVIIYGHQIMKKDIMIFLDGQYRQVFMEQEIKEYMEHQFYMRQKMILIKDIIMFILMMLVMVNMDIK